MEDEYMTSGNERAALQAVLRRTGYGRLRLSDALEVGYTAYRQALSISNIRMHWRVVFGSIVLIGAAIFASGLVSVGMQGLVLLGTSIVLVMILLVASVATHDRLYPHIDTMVGLAAFVGLGGMHVGAFVSPVDGGMRTIAEYGVIFISLAIFTISGLSFMQALRAAVAAMMAAVLASLLSPMVADMMSGVALPEMLKPLFTVFRPDWGHFTFYGAGSLVIAALIGLSHDMRERTVFLQERLLILEKRELDDLSRELAQISREDALTRLANRRHFDEVFSREWASCMREGLSLNLLFIDVDYFKRYNDHYGHQVGDECLARVAAVLGKEAKRGADFVARYGGEEFVALFPRTNGAGLTAIAQRMIDAVDELAIPHVASDVASHVTISVGLAMLSPLPGSKAEDLLHAADAALYRAKEAGRHRYVAAWDC